MNFLSARWSNLVLINYAVDDAVLEPHLPRGLELDRREGRAFLSLVAFDFLETRVLGVPWPGHRNFSEINLRFYVRHGERRGVVFVREFVPLPVVSTMARCIYNEPYATARMRSSVRRRKGKLRVAHSLSLRGAAGPQRLRVLAADRPTMAPTDSWEHFFKEHQWGFGRDRRGGTLCYEVNHPHWRTYPVLDLRLNWDWAATYGEKWRFLNDAEPHSVTLAEGSAVTVKVHGRLNEAP